MLSPTRSVPEGVSLLMSTLTRLYSCDFMVVFKGNVTISQSLIALPARATNAHLFLCEDVLDIPDTRQNYGVVDFMVLLIIREACLSQPSTLFVHVCANRL